MKRLSKECKTLKAANRYQTRLYDTYDYIRLIQMPRFGETGNYIWEVHADGNDGRMGLPKARAALDNKQSRSRKKAAGSRSKV